MRISQTTSAVLAAVAGVIVASSSRGAPIYSQTPAAIEDGIISDRDADVQLAEDFSLPSAGTVRSVTWRGGFGPAETPAFPISFDLTIYGNSGSNLPDVNAIVSTTTVAAPQVTFIGLDELGFELYEFRADVSPVPLAAATTYWFSAFADTLTDVDDTFFWGTGRLGESGDPMAAREGGPNYLPVTSGPLYFVLDNDAVPEPSSMGVAVIVVTGWVWRQRRRSGRDRCH